MKTDIVNLDMRRIRDEGRFIELTVDEVRHHADNDWPTEIESNLDELFDVAQADVFNGDKTEAYVVIKIVKEHQ